jgi:hypothetical protein
MPISINGAGTITGINAGGLPDGVITTDDIAANAVTPAKLATTVVGPAFSAYPNVSTAIANTTFTKVDLQVEEYDTANCFASSRFTPNVAGYYLFTMAVQASALGQLAPILYINGSARYWGNSMTSTTFDSNGVAIAYMNGTTDYAEMYAYQASGGSSFINAVQYRTFFQGALIRPA